MSERKDEKKGDERVQHDSFLRWGSLPSLLQIHPMLPTHYGH